MIEDPGRATVATMPDAVGAAIVTVDGTGSIIEASPALGSIIGAAPGTRTVGRPLSELIAPHDHSAFLDLLVATTDASRIGHGACLVATGRRDDGLPLLITVQVPATEAVTTNVPLDARIAMVIERAGGPVAWADDPTPATPDRAGPDHVLSHDARAQVRNARNFLGLFSRKLAESGADPEKLPATFLDTGLRALATGDEILDRIVWFLRLENDPIVMQPLSLDDVIDAAGRLSRSNLDELAQLEGHADLAEPLTVEHQPTGIDIVANHELIVWAIAEVFTNARKFAKQATTITVAAGRSERWVDVRIANTGHTIDATLAPEAFKLGRMLQGRGERPGVGLGLSLCRRIVLRHGGRTGIGPAVDGTVVTFSLLAAQSDRVG